MGLRRGARGQRGNGEARQDFFGRRGHDGRGGGSEGGQDPGIREPRRIGNYFIFNSFFNSNILFKLVCVRLPISRINWKITFDFIIENVHTLSLFFKK